MAIAFWCLLVMILLPYGTVAIAKWRRDFDNREPRAWLAKLDGRRARAHAAHLNHFEAMPGFIAGVLVATYRGGSQLWIDGLAVTFIVMRLAFTWAYLNDKASLRSGVWVVGLASVVGLFGVAAVGK
jgi:uncharacterized MAPEG superfamily protein